MWFTCAGLRLIDSCESNSAAFVELSTVPAAAPDCLYLTGNGSLCLGRVFFFFFAVRWAKRLHTPLWLENSFLVGSSKTMGRKGVCFYTLKAELAFMGVVEKAARLLENLWCCVSIHKLLGWSVCYSWNLHTWNKVNERCSFTLSIQNVIEGWKNVKELLMWWRRLCNYVTYLDAYLFNTYIWIYNINTHTETCEYIYIYIILLTNTS